MIASVILVTYTIQDAKGKKSVTKIHFPVSAVSNLGYGVLDDFVRTTATLIDTLLLGRVIGAKTTINHDLSAEAIKAAPLPNSDAEEGAQFRFVASGSSFVFMRLSTFDETFFIPGTAEVDMSNTDVDAFVQRIIQGRTIGLVNVSPSDNHGADITAALFAYEGFTNPRKNDD